jgi:hypothetical protein
MKSFVFGKYTLGDKLILSYLENNLENYEYLGEKVDLSRIVPDKENLIVISNSSLFQIDQDKILGYIRKDTSKPLMVLKKVKTFGTVFFEPNFKVEKITTNKAYNFAGMLFLPEKYLKNNSTVAEIFRSVPYEDWRFYIINPNKRG